MSSDDNTASIWDTKIGEHFVDLKNHRTPVTGVAFDRSGNIVATGSGTSVRIWTLEGAARRSREVLEPSKVLLAEMAVLAVAISPDERLVVAGGNGETVRVWQLKALNDPPLDLVGTETAYTSIAFTDDSSRVVAGSSDGKLHIWDVASGQSIGTVAMHSNSISGVALAGRANLIVTGATDESVRVTNFYQKTSALIEEVDKNMPRCLTAEQLKTFHLDLAPSKGCFVRRDQ
jgi:WD40 repeat protein